MFNEAAQLNQLHDALIRMNAPIKNFLESFLSTRKGGGLFLDIGSGPFPDSYWPYTQNVVFIDKKKELLPAVTLGHDSRIMDIEQGLDFPTSTFDLTLTSQVLNNIPPQKVSKVLGEMIRVTKTDGDIVIISTEQEGITQTTADSLTKIMSGFGIEQVQKVILEKFGEQDKLLFALVAKKTQNIIHKKRKRH